MTVKGICLDGLWTRRQADRVLDIVGRDTYHAVDVTTHNQSVSWFLIVPIHIEARITCIDELTPALKEFLCMEMRCHLMREHTREECGW